MVGTRRGRPVPGPADAAPWRRWAGAFRGRVRSSVRTTPQRLRLARAVLVTATVLAGLTATVVVAGALRSADRIDARTSRALIATGQAHAWLVEADRSAVHSFLAGDVLLGGPGQRYQDAITGANRAIEQLGETLGTGPDSQALQAIDAELVTYTGMIEQADASYRAEAASGVASGAAGGAPVGGGPAGGGAELGEAHLWYASRLLHEADGGLLARIDAVAAAQQAELDARAWWLGPAALLAFAAIAVLLLAGLGVVQWWLARRFRRVVNLPLAAATACALIVCGGTLAGLEHVQATTRAAENDSLRPLLGLWRIRSASADADGQSGLLTLQAARCPQGAACGTTVRGLEASVTAATDSATATRRGLAAAPVDAPASLLARSLTASGRVRDDVTAGRLAAADEDSQRAESAFDALAADLGDRTQALDRVLSGQLASAQHVPALQAAIVVLCAGMVLLVLLGLGARLEEYRTRGWQQS